MTPLTEIHLVSDRHDLSQSFGLQMIALSDHLADPGEAGKAVRLAAAQWIPLEMRHDVSHQLAG